MQEIRGNLAWWRTMVRRVARATRSSANAEDYLQSALIRLEQYRSTAVVHNPDAFLLKTAVNIATDERRRAHVRNETNPSVTDIFNVSDPVPLQSEAFLAKERLRRVVDGLKHLNPRTREILLMHRLDGSTYREIADQLGISVSAVEKHIARATLFLTRWTEGW